MVPRFVLTTIAACAVLCGAGGAVSAHIDPDPIEAGTQLDEPAPAVAVVLPAAVASSTEPDADTTVSPTPSVAEVVAEGVDEPADPRTGTVMFIVSVAAVLGLGGFVVYRARQARAAASTID